MLPGSVISRQEAPPSWVAQMLLVYGWYSHPLARSANRTWLTCGGPDRPSASHTAGARIKDQCAPPSAVNASCARHGRLRVQPEPPSTTPQAGDTKLAAAGWKPSGTLSEAGTAPAEPAAAGERAGAAPDPHPATTAQATAITTAASTLMTTETAAALPRLDPYRRDAAIGGMKASAPLTIRIDLVTGA